MTKTSRDVWLMIALLTGVVLIGVGMLGVKLRPYWVAKYRGRGADLHSASLRGAKLEGAEFVFVAAPGLVGGPCYPGAGSAGFDPRAHGAVKVPLTMTKPNSRVWLMIALRPGVVLVGVGAFVGCCHFASSEEGGRWGLSPPLILRQQSYMEVIRQIESGRLPVANRVVNLPTDYKSLAKKVYSERRADGRLFVLFVNFVGRGEADVTGYLYCSRPPGSAETP